MKKVKKIYGVSGMMEYHAIIKIGSKSHLRVNFTEGSATAMGVTPATYSTDNLMFQHAIEHSDDFKSGKIKLIKTMELDEDVYIASEHETKSDVLNKPNKTDAPTVTTNEATTVDTADEGENTSDAEGETTTDAAAETMTPKEFSCNDDAKDFFETELGAKRSSLRTRADIVSFGKAHGYEVTFTD